MIVSDWLKNLENYGVPPEVAAQAFLDARADFEARERYLLRRLEHAFAHRMVDHGYDGLGTSVDRIDLAFLSFPLPENKTGAA